VIRLLVGAGLLVWAGATLMISSLRRFSRPVLAERLRPFAPGAAAEPAANGVLSVESLREILAPLVRSVGDRMASLVGVVEPLEIRLRRVHSTDDVASFRMRQMALTAAALVCAGVVAGFSQPAPVVSLMIVVGAPLLVFLVIEQRLARASERWQRTLAAELPVVSEQLAMLLNAGYSLGAALARIARSGEGCMATDLKVVVNRVRQGLSESQALREWAELARVDAVHRLVSVLALNTEASDLGRLVSAESRAARRDLHRRALGTMEKRAQQVWVPVTVATLVPGVILLAVPFLAALRLFSNA
jgi:tight adherence protein C